MSETTLPEPLVPPEVDLRGFDFMPLDVRRLRDSDLALTAAADAFRAAVMLWCAAWHQVPAASLPNDERALAYLAGYGRDLRAWKRVREDALHGFVLCSDGRFYHPTIAEKALDAARRVSNCRTAANVRWNSGDASPESTNSLFSNKSGNADASAPAVREHVHAHSERTCDRNAIDIDKDKNPPPIVPPLCASTSPPRDGARSRSGGRERRHARDGGPVNGKAQPPPETWEVAQPGGRDPERRLIRIADLVRRGIRTGSYGAYEVRQCLRRGLITAEEAAPILGRAPPDGGGGPGRGEAAR